MITKKIKLIIIKQTKKQYNHMTSGKGKTMEMIKRSNVSRC